jgi:hypothetical protein
MSHTLIIITGLIYSYISVEQFYIGNHGMGICYFGYAIGNAGLYLMAK